MLKAIYPGSFDPVTNGHLDIINRAVELCDRLYVAVARNSEKKNLFSVPERLDMLASCCTKDLNKVEIVEFDGLLAEYCLNNGIQCIIRGLRAIADFEFEYAMALMNKRLAPDVETVFLMASNENSFVSSRIVREVVSLGGDVSSLVPSGIVPLLKQRLRG
jgi:pantetheine-phosphate adenylyltransferase